MRKNNQNIATGFSPWRIVHTFLLSGKGINCPKGLPDLHNFATA
jgi:hypothetical protein